MDQGVSYGGKVLARTYPSDRRISSDEAFAILEQGGEVRAYKEGGWVSVGQVKGFLIWPNGRSVQAGTFLRTALSPMMALQLLVDQVGSLSFEWDDQYILHCNGHTYSGVDLGNIILTAYGDRDDN